MISEKDEILLWAYLDGQLSNREQLVVKQKLTQNREFLKAFEDAQSLEHDLVDLPEEGPTSRFVPQLLRRLPKKMAKPTVAFEVAGRQVRRIVLIPVVLLALGSMSMMFFPSAGLQTVGSDQLAAGIARVFWHPMTQLLYWAAIAIVLLIPLDYILRTYYSRR